MPTLVLIIEPVAVRTGFWCRTCALPSGIEVDWVTISGSGVTPQGTFRRCTRCEGEDIE